MSPRRTDPKMKTSIQDLKEGYESALLLRKCLLDADNKQQMIIPQLMERIIVSFENSITKMDNDSEKNSNKLEESGESSKSIVGLSVKKGRRGCYKRRKGSQSVTKVVPAVLDDGHTWRKYGQKTILNAPFPRSYFKCTHKTDQGCLATKKVQQTESNPPMYTIMYDSQHTCTNALKSAPHFVESAQIPNSILLNFNSSESDIYNDCTLFGTSEYPVFEGMASNASSYSSELDQGMEYMQHGVEDFDYVTLQSLMS